MKKFWNIIGTNEFSDNKEALKKLRTKFNADLGIDEKTVPASQWPYKITKGPQHPKFA